MATVASAAPALARGLILLEDLSSAGPRTLEQLTRSHGWPKTSILRLLRALEELGAVMRHPASKRWLAVKRLVRDDRDAGQRARLDAILARLAEEVSATAECWVPDGGHLVLAARHEPDSGEVMVRARIGFRRDLMELEATTLVACTTGGGPPPSGCWVWRDGVRCVLTEDEVRRLLGMTTQAGLAWDAAANPHGVVRVAAPLLQEGRLRGIIAVALVDRAWPGRPSACIIAAVAAAVI